MSGEIKVVSPRPDVRLLTIANPPMNALGPDMRAAFLDVLDDAARDDSLRCIVVTGEGASFCAGDDLKANKTGGDLSTFGTLLERLETSRVPVIAAINGWCIGGGFELALCCDIRLASFDAKYVCAGVNMGLMASAYRLPRLIGASRAKAMLLTGSTWDAETAERFGLTVGLHAPADLVQAALAMAERIATRAPLSVEATKKFAMRALDMSPEEAAQVQREVLGSLRASNDHAEAVAAFREKRPPSFTRS